MMKTQGTCVFCSKPIEFGTGVTFISDIGIRRSFCSSKCRRNHQLGRIPRKVRWISKTKKIQSVNTQTEEEPKDA